MRLGPATVLLLTGLSLGCTSIPRTPAYSPDAGIRTCREIEHAAYNRATEEFVAGALVTVAGLVGMGAGIGIGPSPDPNAAWLERSRYLLVLAPSAVLAGIGVETMFQSQKTEALGAQSGAALADARTESDRFVYYECVSARGDWSGNHLESTRVLSNLMKENSAAAQEAQAAAAGATNLAQTATTIAAEAKGTAARATQVASASAEATKDLAMVAEKLAESVAANGTSPPLRAPQLVLQPPAKTNLVEFPAGMAPPPPRPRSRSPEVILGQQR